MPITVTTDRMCAELRADLARDFADLDLTALYAHRAEVACEYMLYAVKPLGPGSDRSANAEAIRAERTDLLRRLWLHLDMLCDQR